MSVKLNAKDLKRSLNKINLAAKILKKDKNILFKKISILAFKDIQDHFRKEAGPNGRWKPLKLRKGRILQDTGRLRGSLMPGIGKQMTQGN